MSDQKHQTDQPQVEFPGRVPVQEQVDPEQPKREDRKSRKSGHDEDDPQSQDDNS